ncbi:glutathione S-transferase family protein [Ensifer sp. LCM 4579]|uniref:glutathione S-transferase family protein n=1 Tax=Ensifer sp. LCM 4579 TaxID=1848292 RepID=UPI0008DA8D90|nr:glutathione S-transferase [Ensifer sp. LCM 4579]OHV81943.1 glutathione S-transferase [Ensifer sp. LCM 4579]
MKLYYHPLSGHAHRARLFLSLLGIEHELVLVDLARKEHKEPDFLALNPFGQVPVLDDGGVIVCDSNAILVYVAKKTGRTDWLPEDPEAAAAVQRWLSVAAGQIAHGPAQARLINVFKAPYRADEVISRSHAILSLVDSELEGRDWIAADRPTIADVALYSYVARAPEGDVDLRPYPNIRIWLARMETLPGFVEFQKTPVGLTA